MTRTKPRANANQPNNFVSVLDFGAKGDGTTDDTAAIQAALDSSGAATVFFPAGTYKVTDTISWQNRNIRGAGIYSSKIIGDIVNTNKPLLAVGRSSSISDLQLCFDASRITGNEIEGRRVLIKSGGGPDGWALQRCKLERLYLHTCGTGVYSPNTTNGEIFSVHFDTFEVLDFTYRGFDFRSTIRTGNVYSNLYFKSPNRTVESIFALEGEESECVINQVNLEHTIVETAALVLDGCRAFTATAVHIEGVDTASADRSYVKISKSSGTFESISMYYTRMSYDNTSCFILGDTVYDDFPSNNTYTLRDINIGTLHLKGIADPNVGLYGSYPAARRYLVKSPTQVSGFNIFSKNSSITNKHNVNIKSYVWHCEAGDDAGYSNFPVSGNNINLTQRGSSATDFNGEWKTTQGLIVGGTSLTTNSNSHPYIVDRNGYSDDPTYTWWFEDRTGLAHTASGEIALSVNGTPKLEATSAGVTVNGTLKMGTHQTSSDAAVTGYITIQDSSGTTRKLAVIS